jgi:DNA-damage-inducible protein D
MKIKIMAETNKTESTKIVLFKSKKIRKTIHNNEWWFVVEDIVLALTDSVNVKDYINKMRVRDAELSKGYGQIVHTLGILTEGGLQKMNCANIFNGKVIKIL